MEDVHRVVSGKLSARGEFEKTRARENFVKNFGNK